MSFLLKQWLKIKKKHPRKKNRHLKKCADAWTDTTTIIGPSTSKFVQTLTENELGLEMVNLQNEHFTKQSNCYVKNSQITTENEQSKTSSGKIPDRSTSKLFMILDSVKADLQLVEQPLAAGDSKFYTNENYEFLRTEYFTQKEILLENKADNHNLLHEITTCEINNCKEVSLKVNNYIEQSENIICEINNCNDVYLEKNVFSSNSSVSNISLDPTCSCTEFKLEVNNTLKDAGNTISIEKKLDEDKNCSTYTSVAKKQQNTYTYKNEGEASSININSSTSKNENTKKIASPSELSFNKDLCLKSETLKDILQKISSQLEDLTQILDNVVTGDRIINKNPSQNTMRSKFNPKNNSENYCNDDGESDEKIHKLSKLEMTNLKNEVREIKELIRNGNEHQQYDIETDHALESVLKKYNKELCNHPVFIVKSSSSRSSSEAENIFSMASELNSSPIDKMFHYDEKFNEFFQKDNCAEPVMNFRMIPMQLKDHLEQEVKCFEASSPGHKLFYEKVPATENRESMYQVSKDKIESTSAKIKSDRIKDDGKISNFAAENLEKLNWINNEKQISNYDLSGAISKPNGSEDSPESSLLNYAFEEFAVVDEKGAGGDFSGSINSLKYLDTSQDLDRNRIQMEEECNHFNTETLQSAFSNKHPNVIHISENNIERSFAVLEGHRKMMMGDNGSNITTDLLSTTKLNAFVNQLTVEKKTPGRNDENCIIRQQDVFSSKQRVGAKGKKKLECQKADAESVLLSHTRLKETGNKNNDINFEISNEAPYGGDFETDNENSSSKDLCILTDNISSSLSTQKASNAYSRKTHDKQRKHVANTSFPDRILAQSREIRSPKFGYKFKEPNLNF